MLFTACQTEDDNPPDENGGIVTYTVTFKQDGVADVYKTVEEGTALTSLPEVVQNLEGYVLEWDLSGVDLSSVTSNITINVKKTSKPYTVTVYDYNVDGTEKEFTVKYGEAFVIDAPPARDNQDFVKFEYLGNAVNKDGEEFVASGTYLEVTNVIVKAVYKNKNVDVTILGLTSANFTGVTATDVTGGVVISLPNGTDISTIVPVKAGEEFICYLNAEGKYVKNVNVINGAVSLTAYFYATSSGNKIVTFLEDGCVPTSVYVQEGALGSSITMPTINTNYPGFIGFWKIVTTGSEFVKLQDAKISSNVIAVVGYEAKQVALVYNLANMKVSMFQAEVEEIANAIVTAQRQDREKIVIDVENNTITHYVMYGENVNLLKNLFHGTYTLAGWKVGASDGELVESVLANVQQDVNLYISLRTKTDAEQSAWDSDWSPNF